MAVLFFLFAFAFQSFGQQFNNAAQLDSGLKIQLKAPKKRINDKKSFPRADYMFNKKTHQIIWIAVWPYDSFGVYNFFFIDTALVKIRLYKTLSKSLPIQRGVYYFQNGKLIDKNEFNLAPQNIDEILKLSSTYFLKSKMFYPKRN